MSKFTIINIKTAATMTSLISKIVDFKCICNRSTYPWLNCYIYLDKLPATT